MSDTRNHTTRDQLAAVIAARRIRGCDHNEGISACARCTADALLASDAIAAVRAAAVAETTATIETLPRLRRWIDDSELVDLNDVRAALSGGRTALDTLLAQARADALKEAIDDHAETFGVACSTSRDWLRERHARLSADTGADQ